MREFEKSYVDVLTKGLRPERRASAETLFECFNWIPDPTGLRPWEPPEMLGCDSICCPPNFANLDWPYPVIWPAAEYSYLAQKNALYKLGSTGQAKHLVDAPWIFDLADFGDYIVASCAGGSVIKDIEQDAYVVTAPSENWPLFRTCCAFRGQLIIGNIQSAWGGATFQSVGWSGIGRVDFTISQANEAGHLRSHWEGEVLKVWALADSVVVFCSNGVGVLYPASQTFGFLEIADIGLLNKRAVTGDEREVVWIDREFELWSLINGKAPDRLDFKEWIRELNPATVTACYDPGEDHFYFSDGFRTFVLTKDHKLFEVGVIITAVMRKNFRFWGMWEAVKPENLPCGINYTDTLYGIDNVLGIKRTLKTLTESEFQGNYEEGSLLLAAQYRYQQRAYSQSQWFRATIEGTARLIQTAPDIRLLARIRDYTMEDRAMALVSRWQYPDNRYARSYTNANSTTT